METNTVDVLDRGYVRLIDSMGDDLRIVNAAKASYQKASEEFGTPEERLLNFLLREKHTSPLRHAMLTFEVKAPLMVARQWWKYVVGSDHTMEGWNEASRRYITMEPEFYIPDEYAWRSAPANSKQGSGEPVDRIKGQALTEGLKQTISDGLSRYNAALVAGVAPEVARTFLPAYAMYTNWWWTCSVQSCLHFLAERMKEDAQYEIREYAKGVQFLFAPKFPKTWEFFNEVRRS